MYALDEEVGVPHLMDGGGDLGAGGCCRQVHRHRVDYCGDQRAAQGDRARHQAARRLP